MCEVVGVCVCVCKETQREPCVNPSPANRKLSPLVVNRTVLCFHTLCASMLMYDPVLLYRCTVYMLPSKLPPLLIMCVSEYGKR